jgi:hypothetical protein
MREKNQQQLDNSKKRMMGEKEANGNSGDEIGLPLIAVLLCCFTHTLSFSSLHDQNSQAKVTPNLY